MIVVCDSTILIGLAKIGKLDLLRDIFSKVYIPEEVFKEVSERGKDKPGAKLIKETVWIEKKFVNDRTQVNFLTASLDKGEAEVLALAKELNANLILIDEQKARKSAVIAGFDVVGLVGLLIVAKNQGLIKEIKPYIEDLKMKKFRISDKLVIEALSKSGEKSKIH